MQEGDGGEIRERDRGENGRRDIGGGRMGHERREGEIDLL